MNREQKEIRSLKIALNCLYRSSGGSLLLSEPNDNKIYDIIAKVENFAFAIVVKSSSFPTSKAFPDFINEVTKTSSDSILPLLLVCVNESQETVQCASLYSSNIDKIAVNYCPRLISLTESNWPKIIDTLKSTDSTIRLLSSKNRLVQKKIVFSKTINNKTSKFFLTYFRDLDSDCYKMKDPPKNLTTEQRFERDCNGIPESEYPSDKLDEYILSAINRNFDSVSFNSSLFLFSSQYGNTKIIWNNQRKAVCELRLKLEKDLASNLVIESYPEISSLAISCKVNVYVDQLGMISSDNIIHIDYDINIKEWIGHYSYLKSILKTLHTMDEVIG